jgi:FtsP/CotA-like multicopper oxidase with cupredoxin domain
VSYDADLGPIMVSDYIHESYYSELQNVFMIPPVFPNVDNNVLNGKGCPLNSTGCASQTGLAKYYFQSGKTYRLRLINTGGASNQKFSIDGHQLTVIANDFVPVQPYTTKIVTLDIGQRTDILVKATMRPTSFLWMRSDIDTNCLNLTWTNSHAMAEIYYSNANKNALPTSTATAWSSNNCRNDPLSQTVPYWAETPPFSPAMTRNIVITLRVDATGHVVFFVDGSSLRTNYDNPILLLTAMGNTSKPYSPEWNIYDFGSNSSVRVIFQNTYPMQHPMHLHGHNFWVLNEGVGTWDGTVVNPSNPQRRYTHIIQPGSPTAPTYAVFEWNQDNPGIWPFHCHTSIHVSAGLYINVMVCAPTRSPI